MRAKSWRFILTAVLCIGVAGYALWAYGGGAQRVPLHPEMAAVFNEHRVLITVHAMGASIALLLGPFQFLTRWRARHLRLHRMMGYGYLVLGVGMGGTAGVLMARYSFGGFVSHAGFGMLGCLWLFTGAMALIAATRRQIEVHRLWMVRNFALALAAVTLRLYLPASAIAGVRFEDIYPAIAWLCWVPNLIVAEWFIKRPELRPAPALVASTADEVRTYPLQRRDDAGA